MVAAAMTLGLAGCATDPANGTMAGNDTTGGTNAANRELKNEVSNLEDRYTVPSTVREGG